MCIVYLFVMTCNRFYNLDILLFGTVFSSTILTM